MSAKAAGNILSVTQQKTAGGIAITITGDGSLSGAEAEILDDPPRLMLEFFGILFPGYVETYKCEDKAIKRVRISRSKPDRTRIIFDFAGETGVPYTITHEGNAMKVAFSTGQAGGIVQEKQPAPSGVGAPAQREETASPGKARLHDDKNAMPGRFSPYLRAGVMHAGEAGSFSVQADGDDTVLSLSPKDSPVLTLGTSCRILPWLDLDVNASCVLGIRDASLILASAGPRVWLTSGEGLGLYARAAFSCGRLDWDDVPGQFHRGTGWEYGYGFSCPLKNWALGLDFCSRNMSFTYKTPVGTAVTASEDRLDFSGYTLSLTLAYLFR